MLCSDNAGISNGWEDYYVGVVDQLGGGPLQKFKWRLCSGNMMDTVVWLALQVYYSMSGTSTSDQESDAQTSNVLHAHQLCTPTEVASFLTMPLMVQEVYVYLPMLKDVLAWQNSSDWTQPVGQTFVLQHLKGIVRPFIGNHVPPLCSLMYAWGIVITGSCAMEMLTGQYHVTNNLNLVIPQGSFNVLEEFILKSLNYWWMNAVTQPHYAFCTVVQTYAKYQSGELHITLMEAMTDDIFDDVTSSLTTGDMIFMTPGGIIAFYPDLTFKGIVMLNSTLKEHPTGTSYHPLSQGAVWSCLPSLWHNIADGSPGGLVLEWDSRALQEQEAHMCHYYYDGMCLYTGILYTFFKEHLVLFAPPNALIANIVGNGRIGNAVMGNVLIVKHINSNKYEIVDLTIADMEYINEILRQCILIYD
ncbi:uncharacterized protein BJ212DRAFT_1303019 [Suillus subaureus]|uniref:Uncharacterized protein n=1 Tax=Suillus subaureus TaxID=48587 RepID=A0A9P7J8B8_9AGAM|nr:uncharacterized protein BJ212DRAFT_1303019 [Suillus subaureus]KAG1808404.1 hypothetical protein BJ212DRAFT_1303019 [Suillus subaureus]